MLSLTDILDNEEANNDDEAGDELVKDDTGNETVRLGDELTGRSDVSLSRITHQSGKPLFVYISRDKDLAVTTDKFPNMDAEIKNNIISSFK